MHFDVLEHRPQLPELGAAELQGRNAGGCQYFGVVDPQQHHSQYSGHIRDTSTPARRAATEFAWNIDSYSSRAERFPCP